MTIDITYVGILSIVMYCMVQILQFYNVSPATYGVYVVFYLFLGLSVWLLVPP